MKVFVAVMIIFSTALFAETVLLKNGKNIKGTVLGQSGEGLNFHTRDGQNVTYKLDTILKVVYKEVSDEELTRIRQEEEAKLKKQLASERAKNAELARKIQELEKQAARHSQDSVQMKTLAEEIKKLAQEKKALEATLHAQGKYIWRSALLPGWGQWKKGQKAKGSVLFVASAIALGNWYGNLNKFNKSQADVTAKENMFLFLPALGNTTTLDPLFYLQIKNARNETRSAANATEQASLALAVIYFANLADAWFAKAAAGTVAEKMQARGIFMAGVTSSRFGFRNEEFYTMQYVRSF